MQITQIYDELKKEFFILNPNITVTRLTFNNNNNI